MMDKTFRLEPRALADLAGFQQREVFFLRTARRHGIADAVAGRTGPVRAVEGKDPGRDLRVTHAALDAGQLVAVETGLARLPSGLPTNPPVSFSERLDRIGQPPHQRIARLHDQPIDDDFDVCASSVCRGSTSSPRSTNLPASAHPHEAGLPELLQLAAIFALATAHHRRQDLKSCPPARRRRVDHLLRRLRWILLPQCNSAAGRRARTAAAGSRKSPSSCRPWNAGCGWCSSARWRWPATDPR